jgi:hypothetical protein
MKIPSVETSDGTSENPDTARVIGEYPTDATLRLYADPAYRPPTPEEIRSVMRILGKTAEQLALLVGVRDGRAVRRWLAPTAAKSHAQIDYAIWRLMLLEAGLIAPTLPLISHKLNRSKRPILNLTEEQPDE